MLIKEIVDLCYSAYNSRFQVKPEQILANLNQVHKLALSKDLNQFLVWEQPIIISTAAPFGPYPYPEPSPVGLGGQPPVPRCRKILGVTDANEKAILNFIYGRTNPDRGTDYDFDHPMDSDADSDKIFVAGRIDNIRRRFFFANQPDQSRSHRWIYYMQPHDLIDQTDDSKILVPENWHYQVLYNGTAALTDTDAWGGRTYMEILEPIMRPFWEDMETGEQGLNGLRTIAT
jgi:hypothetical protein